MKCLEMKSCINNKHLIYIDHVDNETNFLNKTSQGVIQALSTLQYSKIVRE